MNEAFVRFVIFVLAVPPRTENTLIEYSVDDGTISRDVFVFMLSNDDHHTVTHILPDWTGGSCVRNDNADNGSVFFILL